MSLHYTLNMVDRQETKLIVIEDLSNELFRQIFSYLKVIDAIFAFSSLNRRFEYLLNEYCQQFDFQSTNKILFDIMFSHYNTRW